MGTATAVVAETAAVLDPDLRGLAMPALGFGTWPLNGDEITARTITIAASGVIVAAGCVTVAGISRVCGRCPDRRTMLGSCRP